MLLALLTVIAALQQQPAAKPPETPVRMASTTTAPPAPAPAPAPVPVEVAPAPEPEPEVEPETQTREVCRYVEVAGSRFPQRRCRTVVVYPEDNR